MRHASLWATVTLMLLPVACQWPDLSGWLSSDPQVTMAGLSPHGWTGAGLLPGMPWIDGNAGTAVQALGGLAASQWLAGIVPWWNHYSGLGMPLAAEMQPAAFLLPFILLLRLAHGTVLLKIAMQAIAGVSTAALLRRLGVGRTAALAGGVLFELNGTFAWFGDAPMLPVAFLPLLLLGVEHAREAAGGVRRGWAMIAVAVGFSLVAGFPETAYLDGLLAAAWSVLRLVQATARSRLAGRLLLGASVGVLLAAPVVLAFAEFLPIAFVGPHDAISPPLQPENWGQMLFPDVLGPPLANYVSGTSAAGYWWFMGGYLPLLVVFLAALAAIAGPPSALRWVLVGWIVLTLAYAGGSGPARWLLGLIPMVRITSIFRYAAPSWEMAACVLAAFALDDAACGRLRRSRVAAVAAGCAVLGGVALIPADDALGSLTAKPGLIAFPIASIAWGLATLAGATLLIRAGRVARGLPGLAILDAVALFALPTLCGAPDTAMDRAVPDMLRDRLGLHRYYSLGPMAPNYGAWFGVASLDHKYLPAPLRWTRAIAARLDPGADPYGFDGESRGAPARAAAVSRNRDAFAALGVSIVLTRSADDVFGPPHPPAPAATPQIARAIGPALTGRVSAADGPVDRFAIEAATYAGTADGQARLTLCAAERCGTATADLVGARDNAMLGFTVAPPLPGHQALTWTLEQVGGTHPFAVWLADGRPTVWAGAAGPPPPPRVYDDGLIAGFALHHVADYFDTGGVCAATPRDWRVVRLACPQPATLIRRELSFPGWRATIDGRPVAVGEADGLFQQVAVPAGVSDVRFRYAPPHVEWAWAAMAIGVAALIWGVLPRRPIRA